MTALVTAGFVALAVWLSFRPPIVASRTHLPRQVTASDSPLVRHRLALSASAAVGGLTLLSPPANWVAAVVLFVAVWITIGRSEPASVRRRREQVARDLPQVVQLVGLVLAAGGDLREAIRQVAAALPGDAVDPLRRAEARLAVGMAPVDVWSELASQPGLERVGRALQRAESSGAPIAGIVHRLGVELAREQRARVEDSARTVGVRAAVPLGVCLLPAFLVVGIVPVIAAALTSLQW